MSDAPESYRIGDGVHCCFSCKHSEGPHGCKAPGGLVWVCLLHNFRCNAYATCNDWERPQLGKQHRRMSANSETMETRSNANSEG